MSNALKLFEEAIYLETAIDATNLAWNNKFKESNQAISNLRTSIPRLAIHYSEVLKIYTPQIFLSIYLQFIICIYIGTFHCDLSYISSRRYQEGRRHFEGDQGPW